MSRLNKIITRAKHKNKARQYIHTPENSFYIVPLKWHSGFIDLSELGNNTNRIDIIEQMSWEKVFTGKENLTVMGDKAMSTFCPYEGDDKKKKPFQIKKILHQGFWDKEKQECLEDEGFAEEQRKSYKTWDELEKDKNTTPDISKMSRGCGRFFLGAITSNQLVGIYGSNLIGEDFLNFTVEESVRVFTNKEIDQKDIFDFIYVIPQLTNQFLYIDNVDKVWLETDFYVNSITFRSINKRISKSGKAIDQFINWGAPGDTILKPVVKGNTLIFDSAFMRDTPIKKVQLDFNSMTALGNVMLMGRPAAFDTSYGEGQFSHYLERPRMLLPYRLNPSNPNEILIKKQVESNYYAAAFNISLVDYISNGNEEWSRDSTGEFLSRWEGTIEPTNKFQMFNSNPQAKDDGLFAYPLYDPNFKFNFSFAHPLNLNATHNPYAKGSFQITSKIPVEEMLCYNYFANSAFVNLPLEKKSITSGNFTRLPLIGGVFSSFGFFLNGFGIPSGWKSKTIRLKAFPVALLMPTIAPTFGSAFKPNKRNEEEIVMPLEIFASHNESDQYLYSGINASAGSFNFTLTDHYYDKDGKIHETTELGITDYGRDGYRPAPPKENGYVIDTLNFQAISKSNVNITFQTFGDYQTGTGTFKTNANYSSSFRNGTNTFKFSFYELFQQVQIKYPRDLVEPDPPKYKDLEFDLIDETLKPKKELIDISKLFNNFSYNNGTTKRDVVLYLRRVPGLESITENDFDFTKKQSTTSYTGLITIKARENSLLIIGEIDLIIEKLDPPPPPPPPPRVWYPINLRTSSYEFEKQREFPDAFKSPPRSDMRSSQNENSTYQLSFSSDYSKNSSSGSFSNFFWRNDMDKYDLQNKYQLCISVNGSIYKFSVSFGDRKTINTSYSTTFQSVIEGEVDMWRNGGDGGIWGTNETEYRRSRYYSGGHDVVNGRLIKNFLSDGGNLYRHRVFFTGKGNDRSTAKIKQFDQIQISLSESSGTLYLSLYHNPTYKIIEKPSLSIETGLRGEYGSRYAGPNNFATEAWGPSIDDNYSGLLTVNDGRRSIGFFSITTSEFVNDQMPPRFYYPTNSWDEYNDGRANKWEAGFTSKQSWESVKGTERSGTIERIWFEPK